MRTRNVTAEEVCEYCEGNHGNASGPVEWHYRTDKNGVTTRARVGPGLVLVSFRRAPSGYATPEYGPCPHCEAGAAAEAKHWRRGYWQGRTPDLPTPKPLHEYSRGKGDEFVDLPPGAIVELSPRENQMRTALLTARYDGAKVDPAVGIDIRSGERRRELVERELAKVRA